MTKQPTQLTERTQEIGDKIGRAIARDVLSENMPRGWTGLDPQDADQIPDGMDYEAVEQAAKSAYEHALREESPGLNRR